MIVLLLLLLLCVCMDARLVLDHRQLLAVLSRQDVVEQRRLATAKEASQHSHGNARVVRKPIVCLEL